MADSTSESSSWLGVGDARHCSHRKTWLSTDRTALRPINSGISSPSGYQLTSSGRDQVNADSLTSFPHRCLLMALQTLPLRAALARWLIAEDVDALTRQHTHTHTATAGPWAGVHGAL